jgi:hypothetical protein
MLGLAEGIAAMGEWMSEEYSWMKMEAPDRADA